LGTYPLKNINGVISYSCTVDDSNNWPVLQEDIYRLRSPKDLHAPGRLSGGPVFIEVTSEGCLVHYELAGIIYEGNYIMGSTHLVQFIKRASLGLSRVPLFCVHWIRTILILISKR